MNESDIEDRLRRYRPIGPPAHLRDRILGVDQGRLIWPWAAAAAVLLVSALSLRMAAQYETASAEVNVGPAAEDRAADDLTSRLGGDAAARELAEFMLIQQQDRDEVPVGAPQP